MRARVTDCDKPSKRVSTFTANIMQNLTSCVYINAFLQSRHQYHLSVASWIMRPAPLRLSSAISLYTSSIYYTRATRFRRADVKSSSGWYHRLVSRKHKFFVTGFACSAFAKCRKPFEFVFGAEPCGKLRGIRNAFGVLL